MQIESEEGVNHAEEIVAVEGGEQGPKLLFTAS